MIKLTASTRRLAAALGTVLLAGCQAVSTNPTPPPPQPPGRQPAVTLGTTATTPGPTPQERLASIADTLALAPGDRTTDLPYTYLHTQTWARASTTIIRADLQLWRHDDGSGQEIVRRAPDVPGVKHQPTSGEQSLFHQAPPTSTQHLAGDLHPYLSGAIPTDPITLAARLAPPELAGEPAYPRLLAGGVVSLAASQYLDQQQRAAALRVLARIPGIEYLGDSVDVAGRAGLGFRVAADGSTTTLIIDPSTGELLAAHEELVAGPRPGLFSYVLILDRGHTAEVGAPW
ncbi:hypothetical protein GCM10011608_60110 [Micromonospora sonchi]|uniref:Uncharacterized protein n=1 Tax=Micromonospora sonchi TaxID=1763543 RepID=A0A917X3Q6_9ACTN|nr:CU044_5270 family protein [Micromonospora sonchi]GGM66768.1 hypothetical protein GCM10011608_60110 [Micromonospora sonchi]